MEPALPALILGPRIPGDAERLQPAVREGDQILLQRIDAEGVADLEVVELAVRPVGGDEELAVAPEEARGHAAWVKLASSKLPSTVSAVASCIARSWCDPRQSLVSASWQEAQTSRPT